MIELKAKRRDKFKNGSVVYYLPFRDNIDMLKTVKAGKPFMMDGQIVIILDIKLIEEGLSVLTKNLGTYEKVKCSCPCHKYKTIRHITACCRGGFRYTKTYNNFRIKV